MRVSAVAVAIVHATGTSRTKGRRAAVLDRLVSCRLRRTCRFTCQRVSCRPSAVVVRPGHARAVARARRKQTTSELLKAARGPQGAREHLLSSLHTIHNIWQLAARVLARVTARVSARVLAACCPACSYFSVRHAPERAAAHISFTARLFAKWPPRTEPPNLCGPSWSFAR